MEFNIERVENGFIVKYKCQSTYSTITIVAYTFEELVQEMAKYFREIKIGENYVQMLKGININERN